MDRMRILVTLNENYLPQLHVLLTSLWVNNPGEEIELYLMHRSIPAEKLAVVAHRCRDWGYGFHPIRIGEELFQDAPATRQYPHEMYDRLLAAHYLPERLDKILYLDPDILVINPLRPLWETDLAGNLFAAAAHTGKTDLANSINRVRLGTDHDYYNSGVLVMDLRQLRRTVEPQALFRYAADHARELLLPDQDMLNVLFGDRTLPLDDAVWNYDARNYNTYRLSGAVERDVGWVMGHTAILHFCGKAKPWKPRYPYRFGVLYQHYASLTRRCAPGAGV